MMQTNEYRHQIYGFWCNAYKYEYIYDSNNRVLKIIEYDADCGPFYLKWQNLFTYDDNNNKIEFLLQKWNPTDSTWNNYSLHRYEYDSNNLLVLTTYLVWNTFSSDWQNDWREFYAYTQQNLLETVLKENWSVEDKWENYTFRTLFYDEDWNWLEDVTQRWDSTYWINYFRYLATWDEPVYVKSNMLSINNYDLSQNYPNPFNPSTTIKYQIPERSLVDLKVYDVLGNEIATLVNEEKSIGTHTVEFNATNLPSGIYFYQLQTHKFTQTKKMILLK
jgi:hypothetical protein